MNQDFSIVGTASKEAVEKNLVDYMEEIFSTTVRSFLSNLTDVEVASILTNVGLFLNESSSPPSLSPIDTTHDADAHRRLGEEAVNCTNGLRLQVTIYFKTGVEGKVIYMLEDEWQSLVNTSSLNVTSCTEPKFDRVFTSDPAQASEWWLLVTFSVIGATLCCCCAAISFWKKVQDAERGCKLPEGNSSVPLLKLAPSVMPN